MLLAKPYYSLNYSLINATSCWETRKHRRPLVRVKCQTIKPICFKVKSKADAHSVQYGTKFDPAVNKVGYQNQNQRKRCEKNSPFRIPSEPAPPTLAKRPVPSSVACALPRKKKKGKNQHSLEGETAIRWNLFPNVLAPNSNPKKKIRQQDGWPFAIVQKTTLIMF